MANKFKKALALVLAAAMVVTVAPAPAASTAEAAKAAKITGKATVNAGKTNTYKIANVTKKQYVKVSVTGAAKKLVTVKKGSKTIKASTKIKGTGKAISLKVTNKASAAGKKFTLKAVVYNKSTNKKVKTVKKAVTVKAATVKTTDIQLDKATDTVVAGKTTTLTATVTPANSTQAVKWTTSDASVATVSNGVVTGVAAGTATITATSGSFSATATITVTAAETVATLTGVKQSAANSLTATFDINGKDLVNKDDITVTQVSNSLVLPVNSITFAENGITAEVVVNGNFVDQEEYTVAYREATFNFTASVGKVASIVVNTASAEQNVETEIEYDLFDANGMKVTSTVNKSNTITITVGGSYTGDASTKPSKPTITMTVVGEKAEVTVAYNSGALLEQDITVTQEITCVEAKAVIGTKVFAETTDTKTLSDGNQVAKFYQGVSDDMITVEEGKQTTDVYFTALDENGDAISYDNYDVESSNDDVANGTTTVSSGKYAQLTVNGIAKGSATLNVKATKNDKDTYYTIPVTVTKEAEPASVIVSTTRSSMSNAVDEDYSATIGAVVYDTNGKPMSTVDGGIKFSIVDADKKVKYDDTVSSAVQTALGNLNIKGFQLTSGFGTYADELNTGATTAYTVPGTTTPVFGVGAIAYGAAAGTYTIEVSVPKGNGDSITKKTSVNVKALSKDAWIAGDSSEKGVAMTYSTELGSSSIDEDSTTTSTEVRLAATASGLFAGYVRYNDDNDPTSGVVIGGSPSANTLGVVSATNKINNFRLSVRYGNDYSLSGNVYDAGTNMKSTATNVQAATASAISVLTVETVDDRATKFYVPSDTKKDGYFARTGQYYAYVAYQLQDDVDKVTAGTLTKAPWTEKTSSLTVTNSIYVPTVTVTSRTVDTISDSEIIAAMKTSVDLNENKSNHESITGIYQDVSAAGAPTAITGVYVSSTKETVKYAAVSEGGITFYIQIGATFKTE